MQQNASCPFMCSCWSSSLDNAIKRHTEKSTKHWFSIYQLVERYLEEQKDTGAGINVTYRVYADSIQRPTNNKNVLLFLTSFCVLMFWFFFFLFLSIQGAEVERLSLSSVSSTLQAFMEGSTLGEFHTRLAMLLSFHCHLLLVPNQTGQGLPSLYCTHTQSSLDSLSTCSPVTAIL